MGFLDKMKATAQQVADMAQEGVQTGQQRLGDLQERQRLNAVLKDLGAAVYLDGEGRGSAALTADIARLTTAVRALEESGNKVEAPAPHDPSTAAPTAETDGEVTADAPPAPPSQSPGAPSGSSPAATPPPPATSFGAEQL